MKKIDVTRYSIETEKLSENFSGYRFVVMSDLHSNVYGIDLHEVNRIIKAEKPDAILMAGDMFNGAVKDDPIQVLKYIKTLAGHYPVFFANGNHEYRMKLDTETFDDRYYVIRNYLSEAGVVFLEDETITLEKENASILLSGVEIDSVFYKKTDTPKMGKSLIDHHLGNCHREYYNVLLAHNPAFFKRYAGWGADLVVSGHVHGGTVRLPGVGGLMSTNIELFPEYDSGMYNHRDSMMMVSRGMGAHTINIRVNNNPEVVILNIIPKNAY